MPQVDIVDERFKFLRTGRIDKEVCQVPANQRLIVSDRGQQCHATVVGVQIAGESLQILGLLHRLGQIPDRTRQLQVFDQSFLVVLTPDLTEYQLVVQDMCLQRVVNRCQTVRKCGEASEERFQSFRIVTPAFIRTRLQLGQISGDKILLIEQVAIQLQQFFQLGQQ